MKTQNSNEKFGLFKLENGVLEMTEVPGQNYSPSWNLLINGLKEAISKKEISEINIHWQTFDHARSSEFYNLMRILKESDEKIIINWHGEKELGESLKEFYPDLNLL